MEGRTQAEASDTARAGVKVGMLHAGVSDAAKASVEKEGISKAGVDDVHASVRQDAANASVEEGRSRAFSKRYVYFTQQPQLPRNIALHLRSQRL